MPIFTLNLPTVYRNMVFGEASYQTQLKRSRHRTNI